MAKQDFINQLNLLGYSPTDLGGNKVHFEYLVKIGKNRGLTLLLGFEMGNDFPMNCPHGPHFKSVGIASWTEPSNGIHSSPFGNEWRHWSRPFKEWNRTNRTVKEYLSHIRKILVNL